MSCVLSKFEVTIMACLFSWSYVCGQYLHGSMKDTKLYCMHLYRMLVRAVFRHVC